MQQGFGILHTVSSIYVFQLTSARTSSSRFPAAVSLILTVPNDDSGILTVIPPALFVSSCRLLVVNSDAACAAVQHGISVAFVLEALRAAVEGVASRIAVNSDFLHPSGDCIPIPLAARQRSVF